ncbi:MAG: class I SAM-dependent methyltransferase [Calditrichaeota bacterium]|nr:MAG: class I SAM-dependent methyltransferase [Calditrichota bacterium]
MWDQRYDTEEYIYGIEPNQFVKDTIQNIKKGKVLCLGAGEGRNAVYLAQQGYEVTAVDSSAVGMQKAQKLAAANNVSIKTVTADLADYKIEPESWQGMISIFCHVPSQLRKKIHRNVVSGLVSGGIYILQAYTPEQLHYRTGGPSNVDMLYKLTDLQNDLSGLIFKTGEEKIREVHEGVLHTGKSAVVQIVAEKP